MRSTLCLWIATLTGLCAASGLFSRDTPKPATSEETIIDPIHRNLLKIAAEYKTWGRVDDEMRWAPALCQNGDPGQVYLSASKDQDTHGQKLYSLFARRHWDYVGHGKGIKVAVGQAIVKQSWVPEEITDPQEKPGKEIDYGKVIRISDPASDSKAWPDVDHFYPYLWKGDKVYKATRQADLFMMLKLDPRTPGTDEGWVYATATPDGKKITSMGRIESCMKCHLTAKSDRLFGLRK
jgi:hypothetical protein